MIFLRNVIISNILFLNLSIFSIHRLRNDALFDKRKECYDEVGVCVVQHCN
jgi:hypothetical protein